jgi:hypothetical protein
LIRNCHRPSNAVAVAGFLAFQFRVKMRSALTAQLAGEQQCVPVQREKTKAPLKLLDDPAFPCLRHAKGEVVEEIESTGYEQADVASMTLPGTAPSSSLAPGMVRNHM